MGINHCLLSNADRIKRIYSHPEAFGQCSSWLSKNFPDVERVNVSSTSKAAEIAATDREGAAISSAVCADLYGINIVERNVADNSSK